MAVTSLSDSLQHKTSVAMDCLCQIALNQKLLRNFESGVKIQVALKWNRAKGNHLKRDLPLQGIWTVINSKISCHLFVSCK